MANEVNKTTEILVFEVDQGKGLTDLEKMRKTLIGLKEEQKQLNDAYKKGNITQEEYVKEITRVDAVLKKVSASHGTLQKNLTGVQSQTDKLVKSNADLSKSMTDAASQINVAGVNVGQLQNKLVSLANPVTATVAIVGALGAAYARSTIGAKDLAFASSQLSAVTTILTNDFAALFSSAEDGEGAVTKLFNRFLSALGPAGTKLSEESRVITLAQEYLEDLQREELKIRGQISERLAENQELMTEINDEQTTYQDKLLRISDIIANLRKNQEELLSINEKQLGALETKLKGDQENEELQTAVLEKEREILKIKNDTEKKIQGILRLEDNIVTANDKQVQAERQKTAEREKQRQIDEDVQNRRINREDTPSESRIKELEQEAVAVTNSADAMAAAQEALADRTEQANERQKKSNEGVKESQQNRIESIRLLSSESARIFQTISQGNKVLAAAQLATDAALTISGITATAAQIKDPKQQKIYKAAAILSATASLAQAAKLLGANNPNLGTGDAGGVLGGERGQIFNNVLSGAGVGAAIGSIIPGLGTVVGGAIGGFVGFVGSLFGRRRGYASGGWTGPGDTHQPAGIVHADEYVTPKRVVNNPAAAPHIRALENMRLRGYATGGFVSTPGSDANALAEALSKVNIEVSVVEISKGMNKYTSKVNLVTR